MSGITRTYEGRGGTRAYTGLPDAKHYAARYREGQSKPVMEMTRGEAEAEVMRRIACYREERPAADVKAARQVILHDDEDLRRAAYPLPEERMQDPSQEAGAYRHTMERAGHFAGTDAVKTAPPGTKLKTAHRLACQEAGGKIAARAGAHPSLMQYDQDTAPARDRLGQPIRPRWTHDTPTEQLLAMTRDELVRLLVGEPGKFGPEKGQFYLGGEWVQMLGRWCRLHHPSPPAGQIGEGRGPGTPGDPANAVQEEIWREVRLKRKATWGHPGGM